MVVGGVLTAVGDTPGDSITVVGDTPVVGDSITVVGDTPVGDSITVVRDTPVVEDSITVAGDTSVAPKEGGATVTDKIGAAMIAGAPSMWDCRGSMG
jgi:hypothetical protein